MSSTITTDEPAAPRLTWADYYSTLKQLNDNTATELVSEHRAPVDWNRRVRMEHAAEESFYEAMADFREKHGEAFARWWRETDQEQRELLLLTRAPHTPVSRRCPYTREGDPMPGVATLCPELNVEELAARDGPLSLAALVADDDLLRHTLGEIDGVYSENLGRFIALLECGTLVPKYKVGRNGTRQQAILASAAAYVSEAAAHRRFCYAMVLEEWQDTFGGSDKIHKSKALLKSVIGCAMCAATTKPDGGRLMSCASCKMVYYCSPEHQRQHWPEHKHFEPCKTERLKKKKKKY